MEKPKNRSQENGAFWHIWWIVFLKLIVPFFPFSRKAGFEIKSSGEEKLQKCHGISTFLPKKTKILGHSWTEMFYCSLLSCSLTVSLIFMFSWAVLLTIAVTVVPPGPYLQERPGFSSRHILICRGLVISTVVKLEGKSWLKTKQRN